MDQSKKTMRHFYCRDVLWETFEQMANDFDCSIDYLINEAMRYYARSKNYQSAMATGGVAQQPPQAQAQQQYAAGGQGGYARPAPAGRPPPPPMQQPQQPPPPRRPPMQQPAPPQPRGPSGGFGAAPQPAAGFPTLFLIFNNQRYPVVKDQFIIGRGSKTSDLAIKDGNISRKHAAVIRRNGTYYIKDLGSTNGIDYKGMRIDNKRIDEGDVFHICDYELRFTYRE
jgi:hypothetical protein